MRQHPPITRAPALNSSSARRPNSSTPAPLFLSPVPVIHPLETASHFSPLLGYATRTVKGVSIVSLGLSAGTIAAGFTGSSRVSEVIFPVSSSALGPCCCGGNGDGAEADSTCNAPVTSDGETQLTPIPTTPPGGVEASSELGFPGVWCFQMRLAKSRRLSPLVIVDNVHVELF